MVTALLGVVCHGGTDEPLNIHLNRITNSAYTRKTLGGSDIDGEFIAPVIQESHDGDCRREIMRHLRQCLSEPSGKRWQRIYGGLALTEKLMQHGSPALAIEVAHGHHFDLVQKVSFLEYFDGQARGIADRRAQNVIRTKAKEFLVTLVPLLEKASKEELPSNAGLNGKDTASVCSKDTGQYSVSTATGSTAASSLATTPSTRSSPGNSRQTSPASSPEATPAPKAPIDDAFSDLRQWMESGEYSSGASGTASPRDSGDESDWEPIGRLPIQATRARAGSQDCNDASDTFFTPMPTPAVAQAPTRGKFVMSL